MVKVSLIILCYNEEKNLKKIISQSRKLLKKNSNLEILIVENGSIDNSKNILLEIKEKKIKFIFVKKNQGYGFGIKSGLKFTEGDVVGWTHGDDDRLYNNINKILHKINYKKKFFLKGFRLGKRPIIDLFFSYSFNLISSFFLKTFLWEITAHPTFFSYDLYKKFKRAPNDFALDLYIYFLAKKNKYKINRFKYRYNKRKKGISSWNKNIFSQIYLAKRYILYLNKLKKN
tara:strand:- start:839 stop:1528 length:690 start_codon:yes stop_codon:yes gene_type:complete